MSIPAVAAARKPERLYLSAWEYNSARVLAALLKIVRNNGGDIVNRNGYSAVISCRAITSTLESCKEKISHLEKLEQDRPGENETRTEYLYKLRADYEKYSALDDTPITIENYTTSISFTLDGYYYSLNLDHNPLFDFNYLKVRLDENGEYIGPRWCEPFTKEWLYDCLWGADCAQADRVEIAHLIYNKLLSAKECGIAHDYKRQRVPNMYDGGYHYENVDTERHYKTAPDKWPYEASKYID